MAVCVELIKCYILYEFSFYKTKLVLCLTSRHVSICLVPKGYSPLKSSRSRLSTPNEGCFSASGAAVQGKRREGPTCMNCFKTQKMGLVLYPISLYPFKWMDQYFYMRGLLHWNIFGWSFLINFPRRRQKTDIYLFIQQPAGVIFSNVCQNKTADSYLYRQQ